uniref:IF4G3 n=1 Tax=Caenorhabditis tropicalis TaxID=1561998 RepID=A0A1I7U1Q2_9PELO
MFKPTQFGSSGGGSSGRDRKEGSRGYGGSSSFGGHGGGHRDTYTKMRGSSAGGPSSSRCSSGSGKHQKPHVITYRPPSPHPCAPISSNGLQKERVEEIEKESAEGTKRIVEALKERTDDTIRIIGTYQEDEEGIIHGL